MKLDKVNRLKELESKRADLEASLLNFESRVEAIRTHGVYSPYLEGNLKLSKLRLRCCRLEIALLEDGIDVSTLNLEKI